MYNFKIYKVKKKIVETAYRQSDNDNSKIMVPQHILKTPGHKDRLKVQNFKVVYSRFSNRPLVIQKPWYRDSRRITLAKKKIVLF